MRLRLLRLVGHKKHLDDHLARRHLRRAPNRWSPPSLRRASRMQEAARTCARPQSRTMQARQLPSGRYPGAGLWQRCGITSPRPCATSQIVWPASASTSLPSSVNLIVSDIAETPRSRHLRTWCRKWESANPDTSQLICATPALRPARARARSFSRMPNRTRQSFACISASGWISLTDSMHSSESSDSILG